MFTSTTRPRTTVHNPRIGRRARVLSAALAAFGALTFGMATTPAQAQASRVPCLWDGAGYMQGGTLYAGGSAFTCGADAFGAARWFRGPTGGHRGDTVFSPGTGNPVGQFSPGARQPGSAYNDYCVGNQLIPGTDDVYELFVVGGTIMWKAVGPISDWVFDSPVVRPAATWRSSSMCYDGVLS
ncbi:hypothetical protein AB0L82_42435 [Nocardia sp. NPDC052001]|uniref:hypothetical protein n=1 Tax=Nocardia sp. NPDC052001 TaxID=3154853 RepID=UPI003417DD4E